MSVSGSDRKPHPGGRASACRRAAGVPLAAAALLAGLAGAAPARAGEGLWDTALETLNLKATPPGPSPEFVERTRPDPAGLGYQATALPHKVSPVPVKGAAEIQAAKDALDAAKARQLDPGAPKPLQAATPSRAARDRKAKARAAPAMPD